MCVCVGGGGCCLAPLNPNINKQNCFMIKTFYSIVIFLTILITFLIYDVVMMLGENRCWSLKVEVGMAL